MPKHCQKKTKNRKPCRAFAQSTSDFCFTHDPKRAAERQRARLLGGYNNQALKRRPFPKCNLARPKGLLQFVSLLIKDTWQLGNSIGRARALCQLTQLQVDILTNWRLKYVDWRQVSSPDSKSEKHASGQLGDDLEFEARLASLRKVLGVEPTTNLFDNAENPELES